VSISEGDVRHVAALARLGIDEARMPSLVAELNGILSHMEVLQGVNLQPLSAHATDMPSMPLRPDAPGAVEVTGGLSAFAPALRDGFFLVPRLATHGSAGASSGANESAPVDIEDAS
jgi:aspartyl-tRNA(Asn)/glutamyl-tRNA(Gln) amidotransferase subunit C